MTSALPSSLKDECKKCARVLRSFTIPDDKTVESHIIPPSAFEKAKGVAVLCILKAGFLVSGRVGNGLVVAKLPNGGWSAPCAIGTGGIGGGFQIGAELTEFVFILRSQSAVEAFSHGNLTLGGNLSLAAGPLGRTGEASGAASLAAVWSYCKSKGLFAGISLEGSVLIVRDETNAKLYGKKVHPHELLFGKMEPPPEAKVLHEALELRATFTKEKKERERLEKAEKEYEKKHSLSHTSPRAPPAILYHSRPSTTGGSPLPSPTSQQGSYSSPPPSYYPNQPAYPQHAHQPDQHHQPPPPIAKSPTSPTPTGPRPSTLGHTPDKGVKSAQHYETSIIQPPPSPHQQYQTSPLPGPGANSHYTAASSSSSLQASNSYPTSNHHQIPPLKPPPPVAKSGALPSPASPKPTSSPHHYTPSSTVPYSSAPPAPLQQPAPYPYPAQQQGYPGAYPPAQAYGSPHGYPPHGYPPAQQPYAGGPTGYPPAQQPYPSTPAPYPYPSHQPDQQHQPPPPIPKSPTSAPTKVRALFDFDAQQADDLSFRKGDIITIVQKSDDINDWWIGELNGRSGNFPANWVEFI